MFLVEPGHTHYDVRFQVLGIPVRVHPWFWLAAALFGGMGSFRGLSTLNVMALGIFAVFVSILIHELGHALVMKAFGDSPSIVLYLMGGLAIPDRGGSWSFSSPRRRSPVDQIIISAAGPGAGFLFAGLIVVLLKLFADVSVHVEQFMPVFEIELKSPYLFLLVHFLLYINIFWGIVNLLPVYPLDGGQIARQLLIMNDPWGGMRKCLLLSTIVGGVTAFASFSYFGNMFMGMMFASLAASSFMALQQMGTFGGGRGPW